MKKNIVMASTLILLGSTVPAVFAEDNTNVDQKLSEVKSNIDTQRQNGKISVKAATDLQKDSDKLAKDIADSKAKNKGALSEGDQTKFCNKVKALDEKVSRTAFPKRTADEKSLAQIRKAIMNHKGLSTEAQNVKLSFEDGVLVLDGPVKTEQEKNDLVNIAKEAGASQVSCKLTVTQ